jgi:nitrogen fixation NifU-like protein
MNSRDTDLALDDLYRELIIEHYRSPHNYGSLPEADVHSEGMNPLCGDEVALDLCFDGDRVSGSAFSGHGCAISQASASLMTDGIAGRPLGGVAELATAFERMLKEGAEADPVLGDLEALQGVARFPVRIKCALLPWKVLREALEEYEESHGSG